MPPSPDTLPAYHFLLIAPNLGAEWLFDAARAYFERFRPIVVSDLELARLIPQELSMVVTLVARRDTASQWGVWVAQNLPEALFDPLVFDLFEEARATLNSRAESNQPFGVPLLPTPTPGLAISPTPGPLIGGPVPTRPAGGFVTQTPTAAPTQEPIFPTPGPITGGG